MGKHGPCYHCGVTSTPLWRNGPAEKPVLCNACGSRWRTKGTLVNYTPLHARPDCEDYEDPRLLKLKNKDLKRKHLHHHHHHQPVIMASGAGKGKLIPSDFDEPSNRSSSGSAVSNSDSCAQFVAAAEVSDMTGPAESVVWESLVPSRKRTCVNNPPKQSSVEKLTKDLYTILQEQQSSYFSVSSSEDLLFESEAPMVSVEIGHGSVLIRHPNSIAKEEESEASSLSVENKRSHSNEIYSRSASLGDSKGANFSANGAAKIKISGQAVQQEPIRREKSYHEIFQLLGRHNSPLCHVDLSDIVNSEEFTRHMTNEDQQKLLKYLPSVDVFNCPESLKSLFDSPQFKENLKSFQQLLAGGLFDMSFSEGKREDCKPLKKLVLSNLSKFKWVEHYHLLKNSKTCSRASDFSGPTVAASSNLTNAKRPQDGQNKKFPDVKIVIKSPKRVIAKSGCEKKEASENDGSSCFSPRSLFAVPTDGGESFLLDPVNFVEESSDQDLLLNVPSNGSFAQAELLHPSLSFASLQTSTGSSSVHPQLLRP